MESASGVALEASNAVTLLEDLAVECCRAVDFAIAAIATEPGWKSPEQAEMAEQAEQASQRTKVLAPVPFLVTFQKENGHKKQKREESQRIERLAKGKHIMLEKVIGSGQMVPIVAKDIVKTDPALPENVAEQRIEKKGEKAYQDRYRIKKTGEVHPEKSSKEKRCKDVILQVAPQPQKRRAFTNFCCDQVKDGSERTDPAAEEAADDYGEDEHEYARHQNPRVTPGGKKIGYENEGVGAEETVNCDGDFILAAIIGHDKENKKRGKKNKLGDARCGELHDHISGIRDVEANVSWLQLVSVWYLVKLLTAQCLRFYDLHFIQIYLPQAPFMRSCGD